MEQPGAQSATGLACFLLPEGAAVARQRDRQVALLLALQPLQRPALRRRVVGDMLARPVIAERGAIDVMGIFDQQAVSRERQGVNKTVARRLIHRGVH